MPIIAAVLFAVLALAVVIIAAHLLFALAPFILVAIAVMLFLRHRSRRASR